MYITDTPYFDFRRHDDYVTPLLRVRLERWRVDNFSVGHPFLGKVMIITHFPNNWNYIDDGDWHNSWWRHQMETFSALLAICAGNSPVPGEFPTQRPVTRSFDVFFDLRLDKRLSKQSWGWWFETLSCPLWRHCNVEWMKETSPST